MSKTTEVSKDQVSPNMPLVRTIRKDDEIYVVIEIPNRAGAVVSVSRRKVSGHDPALGETYKWTRMNRARVSWSGGDGHETPDAAMLFAECLILASKIARRLNRNNPDIISDQDLTCPFGA